MKLAALAVLFGLIGAAIGDEEGFLPGIMFGVLVGVVQGLRGRVAKLEQAEKDASRELLQLREELARVRAAAEQPQQRAVREPTEQRPAVHAAAQQAPALSRAASQVELQEAQEAQAARDAPAIPEAVSEPAPAREPAYQHAEPRAVDPEGPVRIDIPAQPAASGLDERGAPIWNTAPQSDGSVPASPAQVAARSGRYEGQSGGAAGAGGGGDLPFDRFERWLRDLLFGGNTIVRAGILVLLVGVVLLLRYAAEHAVFPIELRMAAAAVIAIALVGVGYHQRTARPGFGRTLQGGGIAGLYLVVFFSFRTYELLPGSLAFGLLVCIALSSGVLAVVQDAMALIVIGQIGGFMAPVLASTGGGSHVALFSYYLLLNLLVFAVAWFKPWRALNLIGFAFTFGIGSSWGALRYRPEDFATTEPFLIAFFLLYSLIPVLYALRRTGPAADPSTGGRAQGGWVDASLVFGTPLAVLLLQYAMVKDVRFGMAFSALGLAAFYVVISRILYVRAPEALRGLIESFLAIGVGFATLAVPYGFDNHDFTGATWALEGAGLYWVGTRQQRWLSRAAGVALQLLAAGALVVQLDRSELRLITRPGQIALTAAEAWPLANARFLASVLVCAGSLFVAFWAYKQRARLSEYESTGLQLLIALGLAFYLRAALGEVSLHMDAWLQPGLRLAVVAASLFALSLLALRLSWLPARLPAAGFALLVPLFLLGWEADHDVQPFARAGWLAFPLALALHTELLRSFPQQAPYAKAPLHTVYVWSWSLLFALAAHHWVHDLAQLGDSWSAAAVGLVVAIALSVTVAGVRRERWPFRDAPDTHLDWSAGALALGALLWSLWANLELTGDAAPLPSWPLLNPLDLAQIALFAAVTYWYVALPATKKREDGVRRPVPALIGGLGFLWFNALLARSVHHFAGVPFEADALWDATPLQVSLSVSWSLLGLIGTVFGSTRKLRWLWVLGASLLGVVVAKLFLVDLAQLGTVAKIGTFLVVGLLLVLVGYFAPVPPARDGGSDEERAR